MASFIPTRACDLITDVIYLSICTPTISDSFSLTLGHLPKGREEANVSGKGGQGSKVFVPHLIILINHNRLC